MGFSKNRPCLTAKGCKQETAVAVAVRLTFANNEHRPKILGGCRDQRLGDCAVIGADLDAQGRDPHAMYVDGERVSPCPRIAVLQFMVTDAEEIRALQSQDV